KEIADRIYALDIELNPTGPSQILRAEASTSTLPFVKAGKAEEVHQILEQLGVKANAVQADDWVKVVAQDNRVGWKINDTEKAMVPDVSGLSLRDALFILENKGLKVNYSGKGLVQEQSLEPGTKLLPNTTINLVLG
ncbi:MAG TPA: cell division protein, partial [Algoriphagus sp.]